MQTVGNLRHLDWLFGRIPRFCFRILRPRPIGTRTAIPILRSQSTQLASPISGTRPKPKRLNCTVNLSELSSRYDDLARNGKRSFSRFEGPVGRSASRALFLLHGLAI